MDISKALAKYVGGELAETAGKNAVKSVAPKLSNLLSGATAKAGEKTLSTLSKVGEQLPSVAQKADDLIMENGKPKVFYHGSPKTDIDVLDLSNAGKNTGSGEKALYFTDTYPTAEEFSYERLPSNSMFVEKRGKKGKVYERNLKNSNLIDLGNLTDDQIDELFDYANGLAKYDGKEKFVKNLKDFRSAGNDQLIKSQLDLEALAKSPYDGFVAKMYPGENDAREYAIFDPTRAVKTNNTELDVDTTKALKGAMSNDKAGAELATTQNNWKQDGDIEGMLGGKFLDVDENYFPNVFSEGALSRATYGADQPADQKKVAELVKAIKNNEDIPPIAGFKNDDGLIDIYDGHHRVAAYEEAGKMPRVKLFDHSNKSEAYSYADEWGKNVAKEVKQYMPANPRTGLDETTSMGTFPSGTKIKFGDDLGIKAVELPKEITPDKALDKATKYLPQKNNR